MIAEIEYVIQRQFRFTVGWLPWIPKHADHPFRIPITDSGNSPKSDHLEAGFGDHLPPESVITMLRNR